MIASHKIPILTAVLLAISSVAVASEAVNSKSQAWNPSVTEKLIKLPQNYLKKSIDRDFQRSPLANALDDVKQEVKLKLQTLGDLSIAAEQADGNLRTELRHQLLVEKRQYLNLIKQRQKLKKEYLEKRRRVYKRIMAKLLYQKIGKTPKQVDQVKKQKAAYTRFQRTFGAVDMKIFATTMAPQSRYASKYAKNLSAASALLKAIAAHPENNRIVETNPIDKADYLRRLVADTDAELALVQQEQEIVGYMAKLVSLNATALAEGIVEDANKTGTETAEQVSPITPALKYFIQ